jgi:hypothetical protein
MRRLYYCSADGLSCLRSETFKDDTLIRTNVGERRADTLQGSTKASLTVLGAIDSSGDVTYTARHGGSAGNNIFVEHEPGDTGTGHEFRQLAVLVDTADEDGVRVVVTYGTTGGGFTIIPTAQQIADAVNADPDFAAILVATPGGSGDASTIDPTYLSDGADDGDWRKFNVRGGNCLRISTVEVI